MRQQCNLGCRVCSTTATKKKKGERSKDVEKLGKARAQWMSSKKKKSRCLLRLSATATSHTSLPLQKTVNCLLRQRCHHLFRCSLRPLQRGAPVLVAGPSVTALIQRHRSVSATRKKKKKLLSFFLLLMLISSGLSDTRAERHLRAAILQQHQQHFPPHTTRATHSAPLSSAHKASSCSTTAQQNHQLVVHVIFASAQRAAAQCCSASE